MGSTALERAGNTRISSARGAHLTDTCERPWAIDLARVDRCVAVGVGGDELGALGDSPDDPSVGRSVTALVDVRCSPTTHDCGTIAPPRHRLLRGSTKGHTTRALGARPAGLTRVATELPHGCAGPNRRGRTRTGDPGSMTSARRVPLGTCLSRNPGTRACVAQMHHSLTTPEGRGVC